MKKKISYCNNLIESIIELVRNLSITNHKYYFDNFRRDNNFQICLSLIKKVLNHKN